MVTKALFGALRDGRSVDVYTITNRWGEFVQVLSLGAAMHRVVVFDRQGEPTDVTLHAADIEQLQGPVREGYTIGRLANRIAHGRYVLDGKAYQMEVGRSGHYLHGESGNYSRFLWRGEIIEGENSVVLRYDDPGLAGFDCAVDASVKYTFDDAHVLTLAYEMTPHGTTLMSPANHAFFNLSRGGDIRDYVLQIPIDEYAPRTQIGMPEGEIAPVKGTVFDYVEPKTLAQGMRQSPEWWGDARPGYDDFYCRKDDSFGLMAKIYSPETGIELSVSADAQCLVFVTPPPRGEGSEYPCFCMETQHVPNAINCDSYIKPIYHRGEALRKRTEYAFQVR